MARTALLAIGLGALVVTCIDSSRFYQNSIEIGDDAFDEINNEVVRSIEENDDLVDFVQNIPSYGQSIESMIHPRIQATPSKQTISYKLGKRMSGKYTKPNHLEFSFKE